MFEIDIACFEQSHDLQSFSVAAVEFDGCIRGQQTIEDFDVTEVIEVVGMARVHLADSVHDLPDFTHLVE